MSNEDWKGLSPAGRTAKRGMSFWQALLAFAVVVGIVWLAIGAGRGPGSTQEMADEVLETMDDAERAIEEGNYGEAKSLMSEARQKMSGLMGRLDAEGW